MIGALLAIAVTINIVPVICHFLANSNVGFLLQWLLINRN